MASQALHSLCSAYKSALHSALQPWRRVQNFAEHSISARAQFSSPEAVPQAVLPPQRHQQQDHSGPLPSFGATRRGALLLLTAAGTLAAPARQADAALGRDVPGAAPLPAGVPPLSETFISAEGFAFDYPANWVVAFDRTGSDGNGAVVVVGDFRAPITVGAFRTVTIPEQLVRTGLSEDAGYAICVEPQQRQAMRFELLRSTLAPAAAPAQAARQGSSAAAVAVGAEGDSPGASVAYEYEYSVESCTGGEIEEGLGGALRCIGPFGNAIPSQRRHHVGRCLLINGKAYSLNASIPEDRWPAVGPLLRAVVGTFRA